MVIGAEGLRRMFAGLLLRGGCGGAEGAVPWGKPSFNVSSTGGFPPERACFQGFGEREG